MIGIRADANSIIATGHVMRCITIAKEVLELGGAVTFFVADDESKELFDLYGTMDKNCEVVVLGTNWRDMEGEVSLFKEELLKREISVLLVDSYQVSREYFKKVSEICPVAYLDDLGKEAYPVDMLINYSGYYKKLDYKKLYSGVTGHGGAGTELLLGLNYAPLRKQFYAYDKDADARNSLEKDGDVTVLLASGGADGFEMLTGVLISAIDQGIISSVVGKKLFWKVVAGSMAKKRDELEKIAEDHGNVEICTSVSDMASLMRECDIAVAAAGTMLTECAAVSLPVIFYQVADNQRYNVEFWQKSGGMVFAGDVSISADERQKALFKITAELKDILESDKLDGMKEKLSGITDARGAERIAKALLDKDMKRN